MSLFDIHMPGVLTVEQVEGLDLDHWLLLVRGTLVHMIVSGPLASTALFANYIMNLGPGPCWLGTNAHPKSSIGERDCFRTCGSSGGELGSRECCSTIRLIQIIHPEKVYACMKILYYRCICTQRQSHQQTNNLYQKKKKKSAQSYSINSKGGRDVLVGNFLPPRSTGLTSMSNPSLARLVSSTMTTGKSLAP